MVKLTSKDISTHIYGMGHKKFLYRVYIKVGIYLCNENGTFGTRHSSFNGELNGPFNTAFACFQLSEMIFLNWSACYCSREYHVRIRVCERTVKLVATFLAT